MHTPAHHHYNVGWLSDDALVASFVARQKEFAFLRAELARAPLEGTVQHYLLVGVRGAGKTTLLKRLAVAMRRDEDLKDHLISLSFPEELYQLKSLADFWWAACDALADELDRLGLQAELDALDAAVLRGRSAAAKNDGLSDEGLKLFLQTCAKLQRRPVLLVDNLDMVFQRIDKTGRKLNDPQAPAYWAMREALSTRSSPIVIGGSVRLSDSFTSYDAAFYDFFLPKRLGKLGLAEVHEVLERLADAQSFPEVKERLRASPGRVETLFELTGGNPRALGLIFELLRNGPNSRAIEDFERLMDLTTPYYKARIEDLSEQAQVIMHALAVREADDGLRFGHVAAEIGAHTGLPTSTVSAQLTILEDEGVVEKSTAHGKAQYRIAEQLFRLWLQMRGTRRIRQNVILLTKFFEAMYDLDELNAHIRENCGASALAEAKFAFAVAGTSQALSQRMELEAYGEDRLRKHITEHGGNLDDYLPSGDIPEKNGSKMERKKPRSHSASTWYEKGNDAMASGDMKLAENSYRKAIKLDPNWFPPWIMLGLLLEDDPIRQGETEAAYRKAIEIEPSFGLSWLQLGRLLSNQPERYAEAESTLRTATELVPENADVWNSFGVLLAKLQQLNPAEVAFRKAVDLRPDESFLWSNLGEALAKLNRFDEAQIASMRAVELDPASSASHISLGFVLADSGQYEEAENAFRTATELDPNSFAAWRNLGRALGVYKKRFDEAAACFVKATELRPSDAPTWHALGLVLCGIGREDEAMAAFEHGLTLDPELHPSVRNIMAELRARMCVAAARDAFTQRDVVSLRTALSGLLDLDEAAAALVSEEFVEKFLGSALANPDAAKVLLDEMRNLGFEKHARPLLLAFEAVLEKREDMIEELEPELQGATKRMFERLTTTPNNESGD